MSSVPPRRPQRTTQKVMHAPSDAPSPRERPEAATARAQKPPRRPPRSGTARAWTSWRDRRADDLGYLRMAVDATRETGRLARRGGRILRRSRLSDRARLSTRWGKAALRSASSRTGLGRPAEAMSRHDATERSTRGVSPGTRRFPGSACRRRSTRRRAGAISWERYRPNPLRPSGLARDRDLPRRSVRRVCVRRFAPTSSVLDNARLGRHRLAPSPHRRGRGPYWHAVPRHSIRRAGRAGWQRADPRGSRLFVILGGRVAARCRDLRALSDRLRVGHRSGLPRLQVGAGPPAHAR